MFTSLCLLCLLLCAGLVLGGFIRFNVFPKQAVSVVTATVEFPEGTPYSVTSRAVERIETAAHQAAKTFDIPEDRSLIQSTLSTMGQNAGEKAGFSKSASPHIGGVRVSLMDPGDSGVHSEHFIRSWERACGPIAGVQSLDFSGSRSGPPGAPVEICIQGEHLEGMSQAADRLMTALNAMDGISQVSSDNAPGKNELKFHLKPEAECLGIDLSDLASRLQSAFYGVKALEIQRGNDAVDVYVRMTETERGSLDAVRDFKIRTGDTTWVPLSAIADITFEPGFSTITRKNGYRQIKVSAKVDTAKIVAGEAISNLEKTVLGEIRTSMPGS